METARLTLMHTAGRTAPPTLSQASTTPTGKQNWAVITSPSAYSGKTLPIAI